MAEDNNVEKAGPPAQPQSPFARPLDERSDVAANIASTPGAQPQFITTDANVSAEGGMTFREIGTSGLRVFSGFVKEEVLLELQGRQGAQKFREMGDNSPTIGAIMYATRSTMQKVDWRVIPNEETNDQEAADWVESCMQDMSHTWSDLVSENLSALQYGYAPHEIVYKRRLGRNPPDLKNGTPQSASDYDDGQIGWRRIPLRGQDTILQWFFDNVGTITGVRQLPWTGIMRDIPMEKMLLFRPNTHKNNPEGRSILRTSYVPYYFIKRLQELEAIMGERMGGVPVVKVPQAMIEAANRGDAKSVASMNSFKNLAVNLRIDEQMGVVIPSDMYQGTNGPVGNAPMYVLELVTPQGGRGTALNFEQAITRYSTAMLTSVLADFLTLGHEARGTQSLAVTKVDLFFQAVEGYLNSFSQIYSKYALTRLFELNGRDPATMPTIEPDLAQRVDLDVLSNFVLRLAQAGMPMFPNDELQTFLLDAGGLPDVSDPRALQAAGLMDNQLDLEDEKNETMLDNLKNPQQMNQGNNATQRLNKMLLASLARRYGRLNGAVGYTKRMRKHNGQTHHTS